MDQVPRGIVDFQQSHRALGYHGSPNHAPGDSSACRKVKFTISHVMSSLSYYSLLIFIKSAMK
jgi:hypothetical protein